MRIYPTPNAHISFLFISFYFILFHFISFLFISFHFISFLFISFHFIFVSFHFHFIFILFYFIFIFYFIFLMKFLKHFNRSIRNVLFNDALNTFYLRLYGVRHMVKDHSDSEKGNPLPPHRLLLSINSKGSFICTIPQTGYHIPQPLLSQVISVGYTCITKNTSGSLAGIEH